TLTERVRVALRVGDRALADELQVVLGSTMIVKRPEFVVRPREDERLIRVGGGDGAARPTDPPRATPPESHATEPALHAAPPTLLPPWRAWVPEARPAVEMGPRFRDWNPDVRAAHEVGGTIHYFSRENLIVCDGCRAPLRTSGW